eukprot:2278029-Rhodomonas_salina.1
MRLLLVLLEIVRAPRRGLSPDLQKLSRERVHQRFEHATLTVNQLPGSAMHDVRTPQCLVHTPTCAVPKTEYRAAHSTGFYNQKKRCNALASCHRTAQTDSANE